MNFSLSKKKKRKKYTSLIIRQIKLQQSEQLRKFRLRSASSPNLLPLLLVHAGSGKSEIGERIYQSVSSGEREGPATAASANVSQSNYFALKSTDDMFKGGPEQGNSTGEKLRGPARAIETAREWQAQKVKKKKGWGGEREREEKERKRREREKKR